MTLGFVIIKTLYILTHPYSQDMQEGPKSLTRPITSSKVQAMAQILEKSQTVAIELNNQKLPSIVNLIS